MSVARADRIYDFPAREYGIQGRWPSPDPDGIKAANPNDPQTWNRYAYVRNSPLQATDPSGLFCVWDDGSYDSSDDPETGTPGGCSGQGGTWFDGSTSQWGLSQDWSSSSNDFNAFVAGLAQTYQTSQGEPFAISWNWIPGTSTMQFSFYEGSTALTFPLDPSGSPMDWYLDAALAQVGTMAPAMEEMMGLWRHLMPFLQQRHVPFPRVAQPVWSSVEWLTAK